MSLVHMKDMIDHAYRHNYAVGAFELVNLELLQGVVAAAERCRAPVILALGESPFESFEFELLVSAAECAAQRASVPVAIHLNHGRDTRSAQRAINGGCNGVMVDASQCDLGKNIRATAEVVAMARACGVPVEGALGYVPRPEADDAQANPEDVVFTAVAEARGFADRTGIDFLAVSLGTVRGRMKAKPKLHWQRLKQLNEALDIPLTIYGGSTLTDSQFGRLVANGVAKINYCMGLADAAFEQMRVSARGNTKGCYTSAMRAVQEAVEQETERCLRLSGAAGRAAEVLEQCRHWVPVEHEVSCEVEGLDDSVIEAVMAEGGRVLSTIPGVREIRSGKALRDDDLCRYSWLVRFCHSAAIDNYREHPAFVEYAGRRFGPGRRAEVEADPITLDAGRASFPDNHLVWVPQAVRG